MCFSIFKELPLFFKYYRENAAKCRDIQKNEKKLARVIFCLDKDNVRQLGQQFVLTQSRPNLGDVLDNRVRGGGENILPAAVKWAK